MSERPTPETDAAHFGPGAVSVEFARRMERERDEAREKLQVAEKSEMEYAKVGDRLNAELKLWREGGVTEELLRKNDGYIRIGKGCAIVLANDVEGGAQ